MDGYMEIVCYLVTLSIPEIELVLCLCVFKFTLLFLALVVMGLCLDGDFFRLHDFALDIDEGLCLRLFYNAVSMLRTWVKAEARKS